MALMQVYNAATEHSGPLRILRPWLVATVGGMCIGSALLNLSEIEEDNGAVYRAATSSYAETAYVFSDLAEDSLFSTEAEPALSATLPTSMIPEADLDKIGRSLMTPKEQILP